jgi:BirA family biotin operon repressor/biotin-[acetyl-CoA-carboxylase] ligase
MQIFTDNPDYSQNILASAVPMVPLKQQSTPIILDQIYPNKDIFVGSSEKYDSFKHLFITKNVPFSQYDMLLQFAKSGNDIRENILCFAGSGTNFHGFRQRKWTSVPGNIHLSVLIHPEQTIEHAEIAFLILAANAVSQTINHLKRIQQKAMIRWVNDIIIDHCKVGGVLAQTQVQGKIIDKVVLGIGLNVDISPPIENDHIANKAAHINKFVNGKEYPINKVLGLLIAYLDRNYQSILENKYQDLLTYYIDHSIVIGRRVEVYSDPREGKTEKIAEGIVSGLTENLELILTGRKDFIRKGRIKLLNSA